MTVSTLWVTLLPSVVLVVSAQIIIFMLVLFLCNSAVWYFFLNICIGGLKRSYGLFNKVGFCILVDSLQHKEIDPAPYKPEIRSTSSPTHQPNNEDKGAQLHTAADDKEIPRSPRSPQGCVEAWDQEFQAGETGVSCEVLPVHRPKKTQCPKVFIVSYYYYFYHYYYCYYYYCYYYLYDYYYYSYYY